MTYKARICDKTVKIRRSTLNERNLVHLHHSLGSLHREHVVTLGLRLHDPHHPRPPHQRRLGGGHRDSEAGNVQQDRDLRVPHHARGEHQR